MNKKEKSIAFRTEQHESFDEGNMNDDESFVLLTKNFNRYLKKWTKRRTYKVLEEQIISKRIGWLQILLKTRYKENEFNAENVKVSTTSNLNVQTHWRKKGKSLKTTWSDNEFEDSVKDDDNISNYAVFQVTTKKLAEIVASDVVTEKKTTSTSNAIAIYEDLDPVDCDDFDSPITHNVATGSSVAPFTILTVMASDLVQIRKRRTKITKLMKQLKLEDKQLAAREACIKNFMDNYEEPIPSSFFDDDDDSSWTLLHLLEHHGGEKSRSNYLREED